MIQPPAESEAELVSRVSLGLGVQGLGFEPWGCGVGGFRGFSGLEFRIFGVMGFRSLGF